MEGKVGMEVGMKTITIKTESCWFGFNEKENGFSVSFDDREKEATIFDLSEDKCSKLIPKKEIEGFWEKLMEVNFQKVLQENESLQGLDGEFSIVTLCVGLQNLTLTLWCPNKEFYERFKLDESLKLLEVVDELIDYANDQHVAGGFEF